ncbi:glycosyltransferase [Nitrosomonas supralitoralis]|nr:glycosyltransferase [Nitrosomonas supralitoralis]
MLPLHSSPLVTIIIRSMDRLTLVEALDSVANQTYPNIEVIVVNAKGGSHTHLDSSYGRFPLYLINQNGEPAGRSASANAGLEAAQGNLVGFLDDDDLLHPDHVTTLVEALSANPAAIAAYSRVQAIDLNGKIVREFATPFDLISLHLENFLPIHSVLFRQQAYEAGARFDEDFDLCEDWDFWIQVAQLGNFIFVDVMTAIYRIGGGSGFAIHGNPELARAAECAVCLKWQARMNAATFYDVVCRARIYPKLHEVQANADYLDFQVKDLKRILTEERATLTKTQQMLDNEIQARIKTIEFYENSYSFRITRPLRLVGRWLRLFQRAWRGFWLLDWRSQLRIVNWILRGQMAPARRKLSLSAQAADATTMSTLAIAAAPRMRVDVIPLSPLPVPIDVVIPIFNGFEFLEPLFDSLERARSTSFRLLVCNDASTDDRIQPWLERRLQDFPNSLLVLNENNLGFVGAVNTLFKQVENNFVLLNSDVQVPPFWLERLFAPILQDPRVASVTPFTNAGAICSFPQFFVDNPVPQGLTAQEVDGVLARLEDSAAIEISTGVGFCMAIRLEVARQIGMFDPVFGKGYREENDWCEKAKALGYRHVLAPNLFVYHEHGGSFSSSERQKLADRNEAILRQRYQGLFEQYDDFIRRDPIRPMRDFLYLMVLAKQASHPALVIIDNEIEGGAYAYSRELIRNTTAAGIPVLHLLDDFRTGELRAEWLSNHDQLTLNFSDYADWGRVIAGIQPERVLINNLYSYRAPMNFLRWLANKPDFKEIPVSIALHDFFMLCPSLFLINNERNFCNLPDEETCNHCFSRLHIDFPVGTESLMEWRAAWANALAAIDNIIAFSNSTRDLFIRIYPEYASKVVVRPHSLAHFHHRKIAVDLSKPLHIGIVGSISWHKGWNVVKQLCEEIDTHHLPIRVTVIGALVPGISAACLNETGPYERTLLTSTIEQSGANIFLFPSIWPETFSYVAHELMACGVPLCCFNLGAPADAIASYSSGLVLEQAAPAQLLSQMDSFRLQLHAQRKEVRVLTGMNQ